jgi:hypothetical protein
MRAVSLPPDRPNVSSKHSSIMRNCSGSLGSGRQDCCASAVWTKAEAAMRTAPTVAILRSTGRIGCSSCATAAVSWLGCPSWLHSSGTRNCEGHCYERESELFKHVHLPWLPGECVRLGRSGL